jgi:hypothetical protein
MLHLTNAHTCAQSGRSVQRPTPSVPAPQSPPIAKPVPAKQIPLIVAISGRASFISLQYYDLYREGVARRLGDAKSLRVTSATDDLDRKAAREKAKRATEEYVVWLDLDTTSETMPRAPERYGDVENLRLKYEIFKPVTGETLGYGVFSPRALARPFGSPIGVQVSLPAMCYPNLPIVDFALLEASLEIGDRIIKSFDVPLPPRCGSGM